jgi:hypothetical protein
MFSHAMQKACCRRDNPAARRPCDAALPAPGRLTRAHHASIPHDEIAPFIETPRARQADSMAALMLERIALSAPGRGAARLATRSGSDPDRMKMRRDDVVPVTERLATIPHKCQRRLVRAAAPGDRLCPGPRTGKPPPDVAGISSDSPCDHPRRRDQKRRRQQRTGVQETL